MDSKVIDLNQYKREKGIALPRSPYYTLNATSEQLQHAYQRAADALNGEYGGGPYFAALVGYENNRTGRVKLLKEMRLYPSPEAFEAMAGIKGHKCVGLARKS